MARNLRRSAQASVNAAALEHVRTSRREAPEDTGFLKEHISRTSKAAEVSPQAKVESEADYSAAQDLGYRAGGGRFVPGTFFFTIGTEAGRVRLLKEAAERGRKVLDRGEESGR